MYIDTRQLSVKKQGSVRRDQSTKGDLLIIDFNDTHVTLFFLSAVPPNVFCCHWFAGVDSLIYRQCSLTYMNASCAGNDHSWLAILSVMWHGVKAPSDGNGYDH